ncbi:MULTISPECIES: dihydroorotate dehydrogenase electron transfer subunit [Bacillaceae]|uniref:dihydroorotate dehydrogenase electron transfer subunit n=1 Tax=Bacillaceae TaxID=186817 RepID=UPI001C57EE96|nr:dihydroorotate dehydrogenase electron transfer subunit [Rossellomorea sp. YZS02]MBW3113935.1 dihydroorotate dehydrogenase electron transfer subunit [Bacillus sp. MCCB 382]MDX8343034.1 dihydroorotate dehydrogenase electron transfer subunit [Rossellomorea sp. YZS02]
MIVNEKMVVLSHERIAENIFEIVLQGDLVEEIKAPGQFVHVKVGTGIDPLLRRPISIASHDLHEKTMTLIYRAEGKGTMLLSKVGTRERVDVLGPLGNGFSVERGNKTALLVGGGIGVPPLYGLSKKLVDSGWKVNHILGFQNEAVSFYENEFRELGDTYIATVDGSLGTAGFVTDVIKEEKPAFDVFYSCGPTPMLKALESQLDDKRGFISLEERMGCGIGACFACVCHKQDDPEGASYVKVCSDGPVFPAGEVLL